MDTVYPNPASTQLNIRYNCGRDTKFQIINKFCETLVINQFIILKIDRDKGTAHCVEHIMILS